MENSKIKQLKKPIPRGRNGGRPKEYDEPTDTVSFRAPVSTIPAFYKLNREILSKLKIKQKK